MDSAVRLATAARLATAVVVVVVARLLPLFDASPRLLDNYSPLLRWDSIHFDAVARTGYTYEHQWAFLPATPFLLRLAAPHSVLWYTALLALGADTTRTLHALTRLHFPRAPALARLVVLLSLLPSSPATLYFAPYAEPFFTHLSYKGMLYAAQEHWLHATLCFALAASFRSNGVVLCGYLLWGLVAQPFLDRKPLRITYAAFLSACVVAPFVLHNYRAYSLFCRPTTPTIPEWCHRTPPSIYTHAQATYWNVGFLRYWSPAQIPNFALAAPPLALLTVFAARHVLTAFLPRVLARLALAPPPPLRETKDPFAAPSLAPYMIHTLFMCTTLLFFSHTQIVLRLAAALPTLYWGAAWLLLRDTKLDTTRWHWGKIWVAWSALWGTLSLGLWAAFLPPA